MLTEYIQAAMRRAKYKLLDEQEGFFGEISECPGVWADAPNLERPARSCARFSRTGFSSAHDGSLTCR